MARAPATVAAHLKARGLIGPRRRRRPPIAAASTRAPITYANEVWTTDFKGEFLTGDHRYCYPWTLRDGFSRFVLRCDALTAHTLAVTRPRMERAFAEYGLPDRLRSDNGPPFGGPGLGRLSALAVWWIRLGIVPERIEIRFLSKMGDPELDLRKNQRDAILTSVSLPRLVPKERKDGTQVDSTGRLTDDFGVKAKF